MNDSLKLIRQLVEDFKQQESAYLSPDYQESQVRQDFIDKFFTEDHRKIHAGVYELYGLKEEEIQIVERSR